jgi:hypothetical protein
MRCLDGGTWLLLYLLLILLPGIGQAAPACETSLDRNSIDFGNHIQGDVSTGPTQRHVLLHVQCERATPLAIAFVAAAGPEGYRFGDGSLRLRVVDVRVDGKQSLIAREGSSVMTENQSLQPGDRLVAYREGLPVAGVVFSFDILVDVQWGNRKTSDLVESRSVGRFAVSRASEHP